MNCRYTGIGMLVLCLSLGLLPVLSLGAQPEPRGLQFGELPASRPLHFPQSSTNKATMGTIGGDGDYFMSTRDWGSIKNMNKTFFLAGVDEYGLSVGYAQKAGEVYLGASYSGSLIDELFRRMTNQDVDTLQKKDTITESSYVTGLVNQDDKTVPGETISNNDVNLILGTGIFGLRLGFAEWIRAVEISSDEPYWAHEKTFESSLKPSLELGLNFTAGPVRIKPALRLALDIHEYSSLKGDQGIYEIPGGTPTTFWVIHDRLINFSDLSAGLSLGFDFSKSDQTTAELSLDVDGAFRLYRTADDPDSMHSTWYYDTVANGYPSFTIPPVIGTNPSQNARAEYQVTIPTDLRIIGAPSFVYAGDINQRLTLGVKVEIGAEVDVLQISQEETVAGVTESYEASVMRMKVTPDFSIGASVHLIPDHFSLHAGLGLRLFSFEATTTETDEEKDKLTEKVMELPSARFAAGLTLNFTEAVVMDLMAITSGSSIDAAKFTLLVTVKH